MNYIVIRNTHLSNLEDEVNEKIEQGYILVGGIAISSTADVDEFFQAMYKQKNSLR